jgi:hypothetical protein
MTSPALAVFTASTSAVTSPAAMVTVGVRMSGAQAHGSMAETVVPVAVPGVPDVAGVLAVSVAGIGSVPAEHAKRAMRAQNGGKGKGEAMFTI